MEILGTEPITHERWLNLFSRTFRHEGHEGRWVFASRKPRPEVPAAGSDAVIIVPLVLEPAGPPRLVVLREFRVPVGDYVYAFPAGLVEHGEAPEEVARRELREETGLEMVAVKQVSPLLYSSAGLTDEAAIVVFVTARAIAGGRQSLGESEVIEVQYLDYAQVCALAGSSARFDAKAWCILNMYRMMGRLE
jgi:ADP-ribose pyrophosphatase